MNENGEIEEVGLVSSGSVEGLPETTLEEYEIIENTDEASEEEGFAVYPLEDEANDNPLVGEVDMAVFKQSDTTVMWRIDGLYKKSGELHSKSYLRKNPPVFIIENSSGATAEFLVTQNLSYSLKEAFDRIYRGYYGVPKREKKVNPETGKVEKTNIHDYIKDNPLKVGFVALLAVMIFVLLIIF